MGRGGGTVRDADDVGAAVGVEVGAVAVDSEGFGPALTAPVDVCASQSKPVSRSGVGR